MNVPKMNYSVTLTTRGGGADYAHHITTHPHPPPGFSDLPTALLSTSYGFPTNFCFFLLYPSHDLGQNSDYFVIHYLLIEIT